MAAFTYEYLLALGSNLGDRSQYLDAAIDALASSGQTIKESSRLETTPIGPGSRNYINSCITYQTQLDPEQLLREIHKIEIRLGRKRSIRWGDRTCDIDIVLARHKDGTAIAINQPNLTIPHKEFSKRDFVIKPAQQIAGAWKIPGPSKLTINQLN